MTQRRAGHANQCGSPCYLAQPADSCVLGVAGRYLQVSSPVFTVVARVVMEVPYDVLGTSTHSSTCPTRKRTTALSA